MGEGEGGEGEKEKEEEGEGKEGEVGRPEGEGMRHGVGNFISNFLVQRCGTKVYDVEPVGSCKSFSKMYAGDGKGARLSGGTTRRPLEKKLFASDSDFYLHHVDPRTYVEQVFFVLFCFALFPLLLCFFACLFR